MTIEILYLAWNRKAFTEASFGFLVENTNWDLVDRVKLYDDGSEDGTWEWLEENKGRIPVEHELIFTSFKSPVAIMNRFLKTAQADYFLKLDNDIAVPPGYLDELVSVVEGDPTIDLLGMEAGRMGYPGSLGGPGSEWEPGEPRFEEGSHIGGVGLMRREAFRTEIPARGRMGFTAYQGNNHMRRGWIVPDLMVPQLDRIPTEPWTSLGVDYIKSGFQRPWPAMDARWTAPYWTWVNEALGLEVESLSEV